MLDERKMRAELHKIIDSINFDLLKKIYHLVKGIMGKAI